MRYSFLSYHRVNTIWNVSTHISLLKLHASVKYNNMNEKNFISIASNINNCSRRFSILLKYIKVPITP